MLFRSSVASMLVAMTICASPAAAQASWRALTPSNPAQSSVVRISANEGQGALDVRCDRGADFENFTIQYLGGPATSIVGQPKMFYGPVGAIRELAFAQSWTVVPGQGAYLLSGPNADLPQVLAVLFARSRGANEVAIEATDTSGATIRRTFALPADPEGLIDRVYRDCHQGQPLASFHGANPRWTYEERDVPGRTSAPSVSLRSLDDRARMTIRCRPNAAGRSEVQWVFDSTWSSTFLSEAPELLLGAQPVPVSFTRTGGEWVARGDLVLRIALFFSEVRGEFLTLRRPGGRSGTLFILPNDVDMQVAAVLYQCGVTP